MSLQKAFDAWQRLNYDSNDWRALLRQTGLDLPVSSPDDFLKALLVPSEIDRTVPGFEDFDLAGERGIEPGDPVRSLLYHAFASPGVAKYRWETMRYFPDFDEIIALENLIYSLADVSLDDLTARARALTGHEYPELAIAVFAYEYQNAPRTSHRRHADLCFSRTGVARAGTHPAHYSNADRGWFTFLPNDSPYTTRVIPARYAAFIAVRLSGNPNTFGPKYFIPAGSDEIGDERREFLVPIHKLFSGVDCIRGCNLSIGFETEHVNEKIRRVHLELAKRELPAITGPQLAGPPFRFTNRLASLQTHHDSVLVMPHQNPLVEPAMLGGQPVTFTVPAGPSVFVSSFRIRPSDNKHHPCPKYLNCRTEINASGEVDLTRDPNLMARIREGGYQALHFIDFTGDGYVRAICKGLPDWKSYQAYSILSQPDFLPYVSQSDLYDWWREECPNELKPFSWGRDLDPMPVSAMRVAANLATHRGFEPQDMTMTAVVCSPRRHHGDIQKLDAYYSDSPEPNSCLPDDACGDLAPGWDIALDAHGPVEHLAAYGLSSPFPEDARLCAAFGANWPAATPDITNWFAPDGYYTVAPLGNQAAGWDGTLLPAPQLEAGTTYDFPLAAYSDWVAVARRNGFDLVRLKDITLKAYTDRVLIMARIYKLLGADYPNYTVARFQKMWKGEYGLNVAIERAQAKVLEADEAYYVQVFLETRRSATPFDFTRTVIQTDRTIGVYAGRNAVLMKNDQGAWVEYA